MLIHCLGQFCTFWCMIQHECPLRSILFYFFKIAGKCFQGRKNHCFVPIFSTSAFSGNTIPFCHDISKSFLATVLKFWTAIVQPFCPTIDYYGKDPVIMFWVTHKSDILTAKNFFKKCIAGKKNSHKKKFSIFFLNNSLFCPLYTLL